MLAPIERQGIVTLVLVVTPLASVEDLVCLMESSLVGSKLSSRGRVLVGGGAAPFLMVEGQSLVELGWMVGANFLGVSLQCPMHKKAAFRYVLMDGL